MARLSERGLSYQEIADVFGVDSYVRGKRCRSSGGV